MAEGNYITIQGWMRDDLGLTGSALMVYAIIYGFSQDGESSYVGGLRYVQEWCGCSRNTAKKLLKFLVDAGLITREDVGINGKISQTYKVTRSKIDGEGVKNWSGTRSNFGGVTRSKIDPININIENIKENINKNTKAFDFLAALKSIGVSESVARDWLAVRKTKRATNTETAFERIKAEIAKSGRSADECIRTAAEKSWQGFQADWMPRVPERRESWEDYKRNHGLL